MKELLTPVVKSILQEYNAKNKSNKRRVYEQITPNINKILQGYLAAALWTNEEELTDSFTIYDFSAESKNESMEDIKQFLQKTQKYFPEDVDWELIGHDFWLSRNHHGSGFFDAEYLDKNAKNMVQDIAATFGGKYLYDENGKVYIE